MKKHKESDLQIQCVRWFRYEYPEFARLLEHPKNEGNGNHSQGAIAKAEGVQAGVADLILHVPSYITGEPSLRHSDSFHSLAIEMKTKTGSQSPEQREWQLLFEAAGGLYVVIRSFEDFQQIVTKYMLNVPMDVYDAVKLAYDAIEERAKKKALEQFNDIIHPKK